MTSTQSRRPPRLCPGARVALLAPSGAVLEPDDLDRSAELCRALSLEPVVMPSAHRRHGYLAGTDRERLADLQQALDDGSFAALWCVRGGFGVTRILRRVDFSGLDRRPKILLGFSDITALLLAAHAATGVVTFHGPVARNGLTLFAREHLQRVLFEAGPPGQLGLPASSGGVLVPREPRIVTLSPGVVEGPLLGGNLTLIQCLIGTAMLPTFSGAILFLEEVGEDLYRIDRAFAQLRDAGLLESLGGIIIGHFSDMKRTTSEGARSLREVLLDYLEPLGLPAASGFPIGHIDDQWTLPVGGRARLDATAGTLSLIEPAVA
jgi:muramoyltetrapeptide carboxypeptidase